MYLSSFVKSKQNKQTKIKQNKMKQKKQPDQGWNLLISYQNLLVRPSLANIN